MGLFFICKSLLCSQCACSNVCGGEGRGGAEARVGLLPNPLEGKCEEEEGRVIDEAANN